ncbi:RING-H2 finger protein ATL72-like [Xenopus tropicalis]|uniref:RING-H2 finger protein ATL72-like n=1 Tax=Xenopus tropicalis TaxID=8364 RepID=A0A8J1J9P3_XENTR|nr:RING-H2 finger protein ATL72-like [Xenopus tropicalis]
MPCQRMITESKRQDNMNGRRSQSPHSHLCEIPENNNLAQDSLSNGVHEEAAARTCTETLEDVSHTQTSQANRITEANTRARTRGQILRLKQKIASLPLRVVGEEDEDFCIICLSDYKSGEEAYSLPCNHHFHARCLTEWLIERPVCPLCREPFFAN